MELNSNFSTRQRGSAGRVPRIPQMKSNRRATFEADEKKWDRGSSNCDLRDQFPDDVTVDVGETEVAAGVTEGEFFVIETEQRQNRRVQVVHVDIVLDGLETEFVRGAIHATAAHTAAGQPHGEAIMIVIAAV